MKWDLNRMELAKIWVSLNGDNLAWMVREWDKRIDERNTLTEQFYQQFESSSCLLWTTHPQTFLSCYLFFNSIFGKKLNESRHSLLIVINFLKNVTDSPNVPEMADLPPEPNSSPEKLQTKLICYLCSFEPNSRGNFWTKQVRYS
jgi:hypothetical protein